MILVYVQGQILTWGLREPSKFYLSVTLAEFGEGCRVIKRQKSVFWSVFVQLVQEGVPLGLFLVCFFMKFWCVFGLILDIFNPDF